MKDLRNIDSNLPSLRDENLTNILLYSNHTYDNKTNQIMLMHTAQYIEDMQRPDESLLNPS